MRINVGMQEYTLFNKDYLCRIGENWWKFEHNVFSYPSKFDKSPGAVDESLVIQIEYPDKLGGFKDSTRFFSDIIYKKNGKIVLKSESIGHSPALEFFNELEKKARQQVLENLSLKVRTFLERGLRRYEETKG